MKDSFKILESKDLEAGFLVVFTKKLSKKPHFLEVTI